MLPAGEVCTAASKHGSIFKAAMDFHWMSDDGSLCPAPNTQLILYPQYPEVRMSGFLKGCGKAPSDVMASREDGRVLLIGVLADGTVIGYAAGPSSPLARQLATHSFSRIGIFEQVPVHADGRAHLLGELARIHRMGWIDSVKLGPDGRLAPYVARNGGGYTLEAHLGIAPNGRGEPDFEGWEVKQHSIRSTAVTLMTPEPTTGVYAEEGVQPFLRRFGYADRAGAVGRTNFGGVHKYGARCAATGLEIAFDGYDPATGKVTDARGSVDLVAENGVVAAGWPFEHLLSLWTRKHAKAVYVPSEQRTSPVVQYRYGPAARLGIGTDFLHLLSAIAAGRVYYDPGIKMVQLDGSTTVKKRSQWRVRPLNLPTLYDHVELVDLSG